MGRVILHIDLNCFYASVEQIYNPTLREKPIAIAGNPKERRGIIITSSYEARAFGIKTTMTVYEAKKICPSLHILPPNFTRYREASAQFFSLLRSYTPLVEPVSIDEGYIDITALCTERHALEIVEELHRQLWDKLQLPSSIGIAPNKFLAKMASDMKKPMGITILRKRDIKQKLWPLSVKDMHGIGEKTAQKLATIHIYTIEQLANAQVGQLRDLLGVRGEKLHTRANGHDERQVNPEAIYDTKSVGSSRTLPRDESDEDKLQKVVYALSMKVAERLQMKQLAGTTVTIIIRDANWQNHSRSKSLKNVILTASDIYDIAWDLFAAHWDDTPVRLLGITVSNVTSRGQLTEQLQLFTYKEHIQEEERIHLLHKMDRQFGEGIVQLGISSSKYKKDNK